MMVDNYESIDDSPCDNCSRLNTDKCDMGCKHAVSHLMRYDENGKKYPSGGYSGWVKAMRGESK